MKSKNYLFFLVIVPAFFCQKKSSDTKNSRPSASIAADLTALNPFTYTFTVNAQDQEGYNSEITADDK